MPLEPLLEHLGLSWCCPCLAQDKEKTWPKEMGRICRAEPQNPLITCTVYCFHPISHLHSFMLESFKGWGMSSVEDLNSVIMSYSSRHQKVLPILAWPYKSSFTVQISVLRKLVLNCGSQFTFTPKDGMKSPLNSHPKPPSVWTPLGTDRRWDFWDKF